MFIVFEGIDGSGKDTQLEKLFNWLSKNTSKKIIREREPTLETKEGRELIKLLKGDIDHSNSETILDLYLADRFQHIKKIKDLIKQNYWVLCSRYDLSSYAYQSINFSEDSKKLLDFFESLYLRHDYGDDGCMIPDLTLFFSLPNQTALDRINKRKVHHGFEKQEVLTKVEANYQKAITFIQAKDHREIKILDARQEVDEIFLEIKEVFKDKL